MPEELWVFWARLVGSAIFLALAWWLVFWVLDKLDGRDRNRF